MQDKLQMEYFKELEMLLKLLEYLKIQLLMYLNDITKHLYFIIYQIGQCYQKCSTYSIIFK
jgi:hypothetical protein